MGLYGRLINEDCKPINKKYIMEFAEYCENKIRNINGIEYINILNYNQNNNSCRLKIIYNLSKNKECYKRFSKIISESKIYFNNKYKYDDIRFQTDISYSSSNSIIYDIIARSF